MEGAIELVNEYAPILVMVLATGVVGGILAGLLGVGGGIVIVPVFELALTLLGVDPSVRMHVAVATSLATIVPTSISSSKAHHGRGAVDIDLTRRWAPAVFIGALIGTYLAAQVSGMVLSLIFGIVALVVAIKMMLPLEGVTVASAVPKRWSALGLPAGIGAISSMMGIGGGTLSVPILTLLNFPVHRAVGTSALFGLVISLPASVGYIATGWNVEGLPVGNLGYVSVIGFAVISPVSIWAAPLGARLAHALSQRQLSALFGLFLLLVGGRMLYRLL
jgi:uncharacterized membrane protein YfcA